MSKKSTKALASATIMSLVMTTSLAVPASAAVNQNLAGVGRYETAAKIVDAGWTTATTAIIASGEDANRVDALTVAPLAKKLDAPVVLAKPGKALDADTLAKLTKLGVKTVYIANGTGVFTTDVDAQLAKAGMTVKRLGGNSRFQTALNIAKEFGPAKSIVVASANDANLVDSLSIASIAAIKGMPIFISENDTLNADEAAYIKTLGVEKSYVVGGLVKDATLTAAGINGATRLAGAGRYESNYAVLNAFKDDADIKTAANVYVASGENANLIDALAGAPLAAKKGAPIVLAHDSILADTQTLLKGKVNKDTDVEIFGGTGAVTTNVATAFTALLNGDTTTTDLKAGDVTAVKAISNTQVEVSFKTGVTPTTDAAAYKVVTKGTTTALAVSNAALEGSKVVLTTAAQTAGTAYTLTAGAATMNFTGIAANKTAPSVSKVECVDTNTVEVTFDRVVDKASAETVANYTLNNSATVKSAALDSTRKVVTLTTDGVANGKLYSLKVENVKNSDGVALKSAAKNFIGKTDTTAAKLTRIDVKTNNRIQLVFSDVHGVDKTSAETLANYKITSGTDELKVNSATAKDLDEDGYYEVVELTTDTQTANKAYTVTVSNLADGSVSANKPSKDLTMNFRGKSTDKDAPTVNAAVQWLTPTKIEVTYSDVSAIDPVSAQDPANYTFTNGLTAEKVEMKDTTDPYDTKVGKTVVITTSAQEDKGYTLTIKGVADEFGNAITTAKVLHFQGVSSDTKAPYVTDVQSVDSKTVKVTFDARVDKATAEDPTNYVLNGDLGAALKASYDEDSKTVKLTTAEQTPNKSYTITINNVQDLTGNAMSNAKVSFIATRTTADITAPTANYAVAYNKDELRVTFDEPVQYTSSTLVAASGSSVVTFSAVALDDDDTTVVYQKQPGTAMDDSLTYKVTSLNGVTDLSNNHYLLGTADIEFAGNKQDNEGPAVLSVDQIDAKTFRVYFDDSINFTTTGAAVGGTVLDFNEVDGDPTALDVTLHTPGKFTSDVKVDFTQYVTDLVRTGRAIDLDDTSSVTTNTTTLNKQIDDTEKPYITNVYAYNSGKIYVQYNESIGVAGSYKVSYIDANNKTQYLTLGAAATTSSDDTIVCIPVTGTLKSANNYTLTPLTSAKDISDNAADISNVSFDFPGSDVVPTAVKITGVAIIDGVTLDVTESNNITTLSGASVVEVNGTNESANMISGSSITSSSTKTAEFTLKAPLLAGKTYKVTLDGNTYTFKGIIDDNGIVATQKVDAGTTYAAITFNGISSTDYTVEAYALDANDLTTGTALTVSYSTTLSAFTVASSDINALTSSNRILVIIHDVNNGGNVIYANKVDINQ